MMSTFESSLAQVLSNEGGYVRPMILWRNLQGSSPYYVQQMGRMGADRYDENEPDFPKNLTRIRSCKKRLPIFIVFTFGIALRGMILPARWWRIPYLILRERWGKNQCYISPKRCRGYT